MNKFEVFANQWIDSRVNAKHTNKRFTIMLETCEAHGVKIDNEIAEQMFTAATEQSPYWDMPGAIDEHFANQIRELVDVVLAHISSRPKSVANLLNCRGDRDGFLFMQDLKKPLHDTTNELALKWLKRILNDAADAGVIHRSVLTDCGRVIFYQYALYE